MTPAKKKVSKSKKKKSASGANHRNTHRIEVDMLVDYRANGSYLFDFCRNLGEGGVFVETKKPKAPGTELELTFTVPDSRESFTTKGTVIWCQEPVQVKEDVQPGMGIQFKSVTEEDRQILERFLARTGGRDAS
ncbi:MAG: TIGR02266 family protein [Zetaproteobacteria bacterium]|nr:TIGR02266 family protein [Zetaproteobacteria bacterium]